ncbi:MAG TPA: CDP-diacylglycerol--serine O-phosphatidyltransferase [Bryobacteraceae bacterium]|nr:CDP-diacylglycerol--serine O-phosphatidyltransferase [Bryobacteraceae bacterium]
MKRLRLQERLIDPRSPDRSPRRAAYALPTLFTAGNVFLGFYSIMEAFRGAILNAQANAEVAAAASAHFRAAAIAIGVAVFLDGLDGRIARLTKTVSDFGREMDSLADVISFGIAPAVLAYAWGIEFASSPPAPLTIEHLHRAGYFCAFLFLLCGALRLARFNVQVNPVPKNPGHAGRKYFVGMPIPAAAGMVASVVYAFADSGPLDWWVFSTVWLALLGLLSFLMVSTWRYPSFKDLSVVRPRSPLTFVVVSILIYLIWDLSQPVLLAMSICYVLSGIVIRAGGIVRRRLRPAQPHPDNRPEHQIG